MYRLNVKISLIALGLCAGFMCAADAAPSIRVLGAGSGVTKNAGAPKATAVKTGNNIKTSVSSSALGAKKAASIKTVSPKSSVIAPVSKTTVNKASTAAQVPATTETPTETQRFPGIMTKSNIQTGNKISTDTTSSTPKTGYDIQDISNRLNTAESSLANKVDQSTLEDYYTKDEVENIRNGYYTKGQIEDRLSGIDASASSQYIRFLTNTVNLHTEQIEEILAADGAIYDNATGEKMDVSFVNTFDEALVLGEE